MSDCATVVVVPDAPTVVVSSDEPVDVVSVLSTEVVTVSSQQPVDVVVVDPQPQVVVVTGSGAQGPAGPPGPSGGLITAVAGENISQYSAVRILPDGQAYLADRNDVTQGVFVAGVAVTSALTGENLDIRTDGLMTTSVVWSLGPLFVGDAGALISTPPPGIPGDYQLQVAVAVTTTQLLVRPQIPIFGGS